jgi:uncharacterized membrane protein YccC
VTRQQREWLQELGASLRGPRSARQRLVDELNAHIEDAVAAELADGLTLEQAEAAALARVGSASQLADRWSADTSDRRRTGRVRVLALGFVIAAVVAPVGLAQRSGSTPSEKTRHQPSAIVQGRSLPVHRPGLASPRG